MIKILDLFCKEGGCSWGYAQACEDLGIPYRITGIDIECQTRYPFQFIQWDALDWLKNEGHKYDFIHASPPCQIHSRSTAYQRSKGKIYPDHIPAVRKLLQELGKPGIIENVKKSVVRNDIVLRGDVFGLKVIRTRYFELLNHFTLVPHLPKLQGQVKTGDYVCVYGKPSWKNTGHGKNRHHVIPDWRRDTILNTWRYAMGIDWMSADGIREAIPPAYTRFIGNLIFGQLTHNQNSGGNTASGNSGKGNCAEDTRLCVLPDARNGMASGEVHNRESRRDTRAGGICVHRHGSPFAPARVGYDVKPAGGCLDGQGTINGRQVS